MRWPSAWKDATALDLLRGTAIDCLLIEGSDEFDDIRLRARQLGLQVMHPDTPDAGVAIVKGVWPGIQTGRGGRRADAGPTGVPWVDSNGWLISLTRALQPNAEIWIDAPPAADAFLTAAAYRITVADSAAYGARWIVSLDNSLATALSAGKPEARQHWNALTQAAAFFAQHKPWATYKPAAVVGVISDFSGDNEFFSRELLNLLARAGQHYRILPKQQHCSTDGLRALLYTDAEPPSPALRKQMMDFVAGGGMLITGAWPAPAAKAVPSAVDRFAVYPSGKGSIAIAKAPPDDPYAFANDSVVLVSHRYDLVRFWNSGATASFYTLAPENRGAVVHLLFYYDRGPDAASVRIAGRYRGVHVSTIETPNLTGVHMEPQKDAVEVHLPQVSQYVALELE
jgi:hypothetical protein